MPPAPEAAGYIASWRPSSVSPLAAAFAREVVAAAGPPGRERAKNLLWAAGKLADYGIGLGLEPVPEVLLHPSVTERFTARAGPVRAWRRGRCARTCGSSARAVVPHLYPADAPLPRERAKAAVQPARRSAVSSPSLMPSRHWRGGCARPGWSAWAPAPG